METSVKFASCTRGDSVNAQMALQELPSCECLTKSGTDGRHLSMLPAQYEECGRYPRRRGDGRRDDGPCGEPITEEGVDPWGS